jgi:hypothetical protein
MRADLVPLQLEVAAGPDAGTYRYRAVVRNAGRTAAGPFDVAFGDATEPMGGLAPGEEQAVTFVGPACAVETLLTVDPDDRVDERDEDDNVLVPACSG